MKNIQKALVVAIIAVAAVTFVFVGCKKEDGLFSSKKDVKIQKNRDFDENILNGDSLTILTGSDFLYNFFETIGIGEIQYDTNNHYTLFDREGNFYDISISGNDSIKTINTIYNEYTNYQITITEEYIVINNDQYIINCEHLFYVKGNASEVDNVVTTSIAGAFYAQEVGQFNYYQEEPNSSGTEEVYICMHPRRSYCSEDRKMETIENYCDGTPVYVDDSDCGCLWGDFFCICISYFECQ